MISIELEPAQLEKAIGSPEFQCLLDEQHRWHAPGRCAARDIFEYVFHLDSDGIPYSSMSTPTSLTSALRTRSG
jgi:hypothetical protein